MVSNSNERKWRIDSSMDLLLFKDDKKVVIKLMAKWGISRRVAREYLDVMLEMDSN